VNRAKFFLTLKAQIAILSAGTAIVVGFFAVTYVSQSLEKAVLEDAEAFLSTKAHSIHIVLQEPAPNSKSITEELDWHPQSGQYLHLYAQVRDHRRGTTYETQASAWILEKMSTFSASGFHRIQSIDSKDFALLRNEDSNATILLIMDISRQIGTLKAQKWTLQVVFLVSVAMTLLAGAWLGGFATKPIDRLVQDLKDLSPGSPFPIEIHSYPKELHPIIYALKNLHSKLTQQLGTLSRFAASAAHELRNPLNILTGEAELILAKPRTEQEYQEAIGSALEEYRELAHLIDQLLFIARAERGTEPTQPTWLPARDLGESVRELYDAWALEEQMELINSIPRELVVYGDSSLVKRALANLVANAIQYGVPHGKIWIEGGHQNDRPFLAVANDGPGFTISDLERASESLYRGSISERESEKTLEKQSDQPMLSSKTQRKSSGLGLSIVKSIMELHRGTLEIQNRPDGGARVLLLFEKSSLA
jgi:two-component system heavy metal sensor histidine kinase CusS